MQDGFFIIKEALRQQNKPDQVVVEITYPLFNNFEWTINHTMSSLIIYDYFKLSTNKVDYFFSAFSINDYPDVFFRNYRYRNNLHISNVKNNIRTKIDNTYRNYEPFQINSYLYKGKGFAIPNSQIACGNMGNDTLESWSIDNINQESIYYLNEIISLCKNNNTDIIMITAPMPKPLLIAMGNYQEAHDFFNDIAVKNNIPYFDFCLIKPQSLQLPDWYFQDKSHLNDLGADAFSEVCAKLLNNSSNGVSLESNFYTSVSEMVDDINTVVSVSLTIEKENDERLVLNAHALGGNEVTAEHEFWVKYADCEYALLRHYSTQSSYLWIPPNEGQYTFKVFSRAKSCEDGYQAYNELDYFV